MGAYHEHMIQAAENQSFADWLLRGTAGLPETDSAVQTHLQWAVTAIFYAALHLVHACLDRRDQPQHPRSLRGATGALTIVNNDSEFAPIRVPYNQLIDLSEQARYYFRHFTRDEVDTLLNRTLPEIQRAIEALCSAK